MYIAARLLGITNCICFQLIADPTDTNGICSPLITTFVFQIELALWFLQCLKISRSFRNYTRIHTITFTT